MSIVKMYDIRGVYGKEIDNKFAYTLGLKLSNYIRLNQWVDPDKFVLIGYDSRRSSPELHDHLVEAMTDAGLDVISVGEVTSGVLYFLDHQYSPLSSIMITASHNPKEYNGFKIVINGEPIYGEELAKLASSTDFKFSGVDKGMISDGSYMIEEDYIPYITDQFKSRSELSEVSDLKLAIDCSNGPSGPIMNKILDNLGLSNIHLILDDPDGRFPIHSPDPSDEQNWEHIVSLYEDRASMLMMLDGDGDRVGVMTNKGNLLKGDKVISLVAEASEQSGKDYRVLVDIKSSGLVKEYIESLGYIVDYHRTGHSLIKHTMSEDDSVLMVGEESGHLYIKDSYIGMDDAIYNVFRLIFDIVKLDAHRDLDDYLSGRMPKTHEKSIKIPVEDRLKSEVMSKIILELKNRTHINDEVLLIDGIRVNTDSGWVLVRQSNTEPYIGINIENYDDSSPTEMSKIVESTVKVIIHQLSDN